MSDGLLPQAEVLASLSRMRMLPPRMYEGTLSRAEKWLFPQFKALDTPIGATCLHSVGLPEHIRHSGEIDFLVVCRSGVVVLEVKGGAISCRDGTWEWEGRTENRERAVISPYVQASQASHALLEKLTRILGDDFMRKVAIGHGVIFPHVNRFDYTSVETPAAASITLDGAKIASRGLGGALEDLYRHWKSELHGKQRLDDAEVKRIVDAVRSNFERAESLAVRSAAVVKQLDAFTQEQYDRLDVLVFLKRAIVTGGAGTGKTFIATEMARRFASDGKSVLFITYSDSLASFLAQRLAGVGNVTVQSFNAHLKYRVPGWRQLPGYLASRNATDPWFRTVLLPAAKAASLPTQADVLIIDEGQDFLTMDCLDILSEAVRGGLEAGTWRFFHDVSRQASPFVGADPEALPYLESLVDRPETLRTLTLTQNCRNSKNVVAFVKNTCDTDIGNPRETDERLLPIRRDKCSTEADFVTKLVEHLTRLRDGGVPLEHISILSPRTYHDSSVAKLPPPWRNRVTVCEPGAPWHVPLPPLTFVSIDDIRGLENQHIIITDLENIDTGPVECARFYIAITRARVSLMVLATPEASKRINELQELAQRDTDNSG